MSGGWVTVASVGDLPADALIGVDVEDDHVVLANLGDRIVAFGADCTHAGCPLDDGELEPASGQLTCWCHGSVFDLRTGAVVSPPAKEALRPWPVRVEGEQVQVSRGAARESEG